MTTTQTTQAAQNKQTTQTTAASPAVATFFEKATSTWQYVVSCPETREAIIIDSVLDYDPASGKISTESMDVLLRHIDNEDLTVTRILETHAHADHLTASHYLQQRLPNHPPICIGEHIGQVQKTFGPKYQIPAADLQNQFDVLFRDGETFRLGNMEGRILHLPGHTPDHIGYVIGDSVFCGDSVFMPDVGSARADFAGGSAKTLYNSSQKLFGLPDHFKLYVGHDYPPPERGDGPRAYTTVASQKLENKHVKTGTVESEFCEWRATRDAGLATPRLLHAAMQTNLRAGRLPVAADGVIFFKTPVTVKL